MVTMSNVWDRTVEVLHARGGMLAGIATVALWLPAVARDAVVLATTPGTFAFGGLTAFLTLVAAALALWGHLALIAVATDPAVTRAGAMRQATTRLLSAIGVTIVAVIAAMLLLVPVTIAIGLSGADLTALSTTGAMPDIGSSTIGFLLLYLLAMLIVGLAVAARLVLLYAVVLHERLEIGALKRSWRLTRGLTWRIVGVLILYGIVAGVAAGAAQGITGTVFALLLKDIGLVAFLVAVVAGVVTTILSVVAATFVAQLYVAVTPRGVADVLA